MPFTKGHPIYKGSEKGWFKKGDHPNVETEFKKGRHPSVNTEIKKGQRLSPKTEFGNRSPWNKGIKTGLTPKNFKGDDVGYEALHGWIRRHKGTPTDCQFCGKNKKKYSWANISGEYKRSLDDYVSLCYSCHKKYDLERRSRRSR